MDLDVVDVAQRICVETSVLGLFCDAMAKSGEVCTIKEQEQCLEYVQSVLG